MLCGRFVVAPPHDRLIRSYLPLQLVVRTEDTCIATQSLPQAERLSRLVALMRAEAMDNEVGSGAVLNALSSALFALTLRAAGEAGQARTGCWRWPPTQGLRLRPLLCSATQLERGRFLNWPDFAACRALHSGGISTPVSAARRWIC
jgi:Cupin